MTLTPTAEQFATGKIPQEQPLRKLTNLDTGETFDKTGSELFNFAQVGAGATDEQILAGLKQQGLGNFSLGGVLPSDINVGAQSSEDIVGGSSGIREGQNVVRSDVANLANSNADLLGGSGSPLDLSQSVLNLNQMLGGIGDVSSEEQRRIEQAGLSAGLGFDPLIAEAR